MSLLYVAFVVLLSCCGLQYVGEYNDFEDDKSAVSVPNSANEIILMFKYAMVFL